MEIKAHHCGTIVNNLFKTFFATYYMNMRQNVNECVIIIFIHIRKFKLTYPYILTIKDWNGNYNIDILFVIIVSLKENMYECFIIFASIKKCLYKITCLSFCFYIVYQIYNPIFLS